MTTAGDAWIAGDAYEPFIGRWSRLVGREFLAWLAPPANARWLDLGCGTGALTANILANAAPALICSLDASPGYIKFARRHVADSRVSFAVADALDLPVATDSIDVLVSGLVINFIAEPERAIAEMVRVVRTNGAVALYVWDYAGEMQLLRRFWDAAAALDERAQTADEGPRFPLCNPAALEALLGTAGLTHIQSSAIAVRTRFRDFSDYWEPFLGGQGPAPGYVATLNERQRLELRERLQATLPTAADGSIELVARAWAVRGTSA